MLVRRTLRDWKSKRAPAEPEAPDAGKKGKKGAPPPPADESAAESDAEMPGDLKAFVGSSLRKAFGGLRETVAPPAQRRKRAHPAPSRRSSVQSKLSRALSRRMTMRSLMAGPSGKSDMLERAKQASRILSEEALFGAEGTEEAGE